MCRKKAVMSPDKRVEAGVGFHEQRALGSQLCEDGESAVIPS